MRMRVIVDLQRCESHGQCVMAAPEVFTGFDADGVLEYDPYPDPSQRPAIEQAIAVCPAAAIRLEEAGG